MLFGGTMAITGLIVFIIGLAKVLRHRKISNWPTTTGQFSKKEVIQSSEGGLKGYDAIIEYTYNVGGKEYVGTSLNAHDMKGKELSDIMKGEAEQIIKKLDEEVNVRYDPKKPSRCYLYYGSIVKEIIWLFLGGVVFLLGLLYFTTDMLGLIE